MLACSFVAAAFWLSHISPGRCSKSRASSRERAWRGEDGRATAVSRDTLAEGEGATAVAEEEASLAAAAEEEEAAVPQRVERSTTGDETTGALAVGAAAAIGSSAGWQRGSDSHAARLSRGLEVSLAEACSLAKHVCEPSLPLAAPTIAPSEGLEGAPSRIGLSSRRGLWGAPMAAATKEEEEQEQVLGPTHKEDATTLCTDGCWAAAAEAAAWTRESDGLGSGARS